MKLLVLLSLFISISANAQTAVDYYNKGSEEANNKDFESSVADFSKAIKLDNTYTDAYYNRGTSKLYLKDYKSAIADFSKSIELKPDFVSAYKNRGAAKLKLNDYSGAISDFDMVIKLDPTNASAFFMRGQVKLQISDANSGCADLAKANELGDARAQKFIDQYCRGIVSKEVRKGESLRIDWPDAEGWKVASNQETKEEKVIELLRNNETFDNWTEIGTMMVYPVVKGTTVDIVMQVMFEQAKKTCPSAVLTFIEKDDKTKYPWILFKIECGISKPESQVWQIMFGSDDMFVNFRAVKQKTVPDELKKKWVNFFKTVSIVTN